MRITKNTLLATVGAGVALLTPFFALAQSLPDTGYFSGFLDSLDPIVNAAIPIALSLGLLLFLWGLVKYIFNAGSEEAKAEGRNIMIWGVIALFVMVSIWGLVKFLGQITDVQQTNVLPTRPQGF